MSTQDNNNIIINKIIEILKTLNTKLNSKLCMSTLRVLLINNKYNEKNINKFF